MISGYLLPALWGGVLLAALVGYGSLVRRVLFPDDRPGWANLAARGMALWVVLAGGLNLVNGLSRPLVLALVVLGLVLALPEIRRPRPVSPARVLSLLSIVVVAGFQYLQSVAANSPAIQDDVRGYFAFPKQMLEMGGIAADPYNGYRLTTGLGGQASLQAPVLALFDFRNLYLVEGMATVICAGLILRIAERKKLGGMSAWILAMFFLAFPLNHLGYRINGSSFTTGMVVFLALFEVLDGDDLHEGKPVRNALLVALLAACACALKTNLIPFLVFILALSYLRYLLATRFSPAALAEAALLPLLVLAMALPWMVALQRSSGTLLYPIFGMGYDEYTYGRYLAENFAGGLDIRQKLDIIFHRFLLDPSFLSLIMLGALSLAGTRFGRRAGAQAFVLGSMAAAIAILLQGDLTNPFPFYRYLFVGLFISLVVVAAHLFDVSARRSALRLVAPGAVVGTLLWCSIHGGNGMSTAAGWLKELAGEVGPARPLFSAAEKEVYARAQAAVPPGEAILSRDNHTLLYDGGRNRIYNVSDPGACSPPPGMPYFQGPEAMANYLLAQNIRYVAYQYANQAAYPVAANLFRHKPSRPYIHRVFERAKVALDRDLGELGASRKRVYDDGMRFVIDLKSLAENPAPYREPNYFQEGKILVLAWAQTEGFDSNKVWTSGHGVIEDIQYQRGRGDDLLVLNTFGYHPWKGDLAKLRLAVSVDGTPLPFVRQSGNAYVFSLKAVERPITRITIDSSTFVPREQKIRFGLDDDTRTLGIDVDTIEIG